MKCVREGGGGAAEERRERIMATLSNLLKAFRHIWSTTIRY